MRQQLLNFTRPLRRQERESNPLSYSLALACAITFSLYCNVTRRYAGGQNLVVLFLC